MDIIWMIFIGFLIGLVARALKPGKDSLGFIMTTILGILGSVLASFAGRAMGVYEQGDAVSFIAATLGAIALLFICQFIKGKRA
jgi:uncharacterized membrane protein YeaQ/YmgE (transglycosylase-associated protein family)